MRTTTGASLRRCAIVAAVVAFGSSGAATETPEFRYGFSGSTLSRVDLLDAQASLEIWLNRVAQGMDLGIRPVVKAYRGSAGLTESIEAATLDAVSLPTLEYLQLEASLPLEASLVGTADSVATRKYVLLARRDLDVRSLDGLQGLDLRVQIGGVGKVSRLWLDVLALREGYASGDDLLGTVTETLGASRTVLPVFFGQAQACVVGERSFATLTELNPQLAADLVVLAESPAFLWSVTCFRGDFDAELRASLEQAAIQMHRDPQGLQALMLFGIDRIRLLQPSDLDSVEELLREHASLTATTSAPPRGHDLPRTRAAALGEGR